MIRFRSWRAALAVAFPRVVLLVVAGMASAADATPSALAAPHQRGHVHGLACPRVAFRDATLAIQPESPRDSLIGAEN